MPQYPPGAGHNSSRARTKFTNLHAAASSDLRDRCLSRPDTTLPTLAGGFAGTRVSHESVDSTGISADGRGSIARICTEAGGDRMGLSAAATLRSILPQELFSGEGRLFACALAWT